MWVFLHVYPALGHCLPLFLLLFVVFLYDFSCCYRASPILMPFKIVILHCKRLSCLLAIARRSAFTEIPEIYLKSVVKKQDKLKQLGYLKLYL